MTDQREVRRSNILANKGADIQNVSKKAEGGTYRDPNCVQAKIHQEIDVLLRKPSGPKPDSEVYPVQHIKNDKLTNVHQIYCRRYPDKPLQTRLWLNLACISPHNKVQIHTILTQCTSSSHCRIHLPCLANVAAASMAIKNDINTPQN